jgi:allantoate deiminase
MSDDIARLVARLEELGAVSDTPGALCRTFLSPAMERATALVAGWMQEQGANVTSDGWGNLIGHFAGAVKEAHTLLLGSHLDTVPNAGRYDGPLGVLVALAALEQLARRSVKLAFHVDVLAFGDEEGTRFHSAYLGSKAVAGLITRDDLALRDAEGVTVAEAVAKYQGVEIVALPAPRYNPAQLLGYVEVHIEQGPVLQDLKEPLGVVDAIAAQARLVYDVHGVAGHAGTTPMARRHDALVGAAQIVPIVEQTALSIPGLVATVGQFTVGPGASNVIPDHVRFSVDVRHPDTVIVQQACEHIERETTRLTAQRGLRFEMTRVQSTEGVACSPELRTGLNRAAFGERAPVHGLVSGAGHDGVILSRLTPIAMLFVRCRDGISHHPDEHVEPADIGAAVATLARFLEGLA